MSDRLETPQHSQSVVAPEPTSSLNVTSTTDKCFLQEEMEQRNWTDLELPGQLLNLSCD
jgi:hypothetical protein